MKKNGFISMTLVYTFLILFMFLMLAILRTYTEKDKFLQAINDQIDNDIGVAKGSRVTAINRLLEDNMPSSDSHIRYFKISNELQGNGNGLFYMDKRNYSGYDLNDLTDENADRYTSRIYYFRGEVENNHIIFAGMCFRILRTNEDGSIRIVYNGTPSSNKCNTVAQVHDNPSLASIGTAKFNTTESVEYVKVVSGSVPQADDTNVQSPIIQILNDWYSNKFIGTTNYTDFISKGTMFCNNKRVYQSSSYYASRELSPLFIDNTHINIYDDDSIKNIISLKCADGTDRFNITENTILYPVGLLTAQDVVLAGGYLDIGDDDPYKGGPENAIKNEGYYLYTHSNYWTMSPLSNDGKVIYVDEDGTLKGALSTNEYNIRPVISLNSNIVIASGTGKADNPYIIKY